MIKVVSKAPQSPQPTTWCVRQQLILPSFHCSRNLLFIHPAKGPWAHTSTSSVFWDAAEPVLGVPWFRMLPGQVNGQGEHNFESEGLWVQSLIGLITFVCLLELQLENHLLS